MTSSRRPSNGIYVGDQVKDRTLSRGIYGYSAMLVEALALHMPAAQIVVIGNRANRLDMSGGAAATAVPFVEVPDACAGGVFRLAGDHLVAPLLARKHALNLLHFPKGFVPLARLGMPRSATLHDTIPLHYQRHHPGFFPRAKLRYLAAMIRHALRTTSGVVTDTEFSRRELLAAASTWGLKSVQISVCPLAPHAQFREVGEAATPLHERPATLLHIGSRLPHKRTPQTIAAFQEMNRRCGGRWRLRVLGLPSKPAEWGPAGSSDVEFAAAPDVLSLAREMASARALLLLSEVEGFGLPAVEAWAAGTPVCYTMGGALGEVLHGFPGACAGPDATELERALADLELLSPQLLSGLRAQILERYSPSRLGARMAELVGDWLGRA
jgi:alpha-1,3-rhamnosyl/mannosyltransferase